MNKEEQVCVWTERNRCDGKEYYELTELRSSMKRYQFSILPVHVRQLEGGGAGVWLNRRIQLLDLVYQIAFLFELYGANLACKCKCKCGGRDIEIVYTVQMTFEFLSYFLCGSFIYRKNLIFFLEFILPVGCNIWT
jgi:hypothetical protein